MLRTAQVAAVYVCVTLLVALPPAQASAFPDVEGHWAAPGVRRLAARGLLAGFPDGTFRPDAPITRAELSKLLAVALRQEDAARRLQAVAPRFTDLARTHWANGFVAVHEELGIIRGYPDGTFGPERSLIRAELAVLLVRALGVAPPAAPPPSAFRDRAAIPAWAAGAVAEAVRRGLLTGYPDGTFLPDAPVTRAEAATVLARFMEERGGLYDVAGVLVSPPQGGRVAVRVGDRVLTFDVAPGAVLERNRGAAGGLGGSAPRAGDQVFLILDDRLRVRWMDAAYADRLGQVARVDTAGGRVVIRPPGGAEETLAVAPGAPVFRNGRRASLAEVRVGDRVYALLDVVGGRVRGLDAVSADLTGVLMHVNPAGQTVTVARTGTDVFQAVTVPVAPGAVAAQGEAAVAWTGLVAGGTVTIALDEDGRATYLENVLPAAPPVTLGPLFARSAVAAGGDPLAPDPPTPTPAAALQAQLLGTNPGVQAATEPGGSLGADPRTSAAVSREALGIEAFAAAAGGPADGRGVTIAIIDTGIDPTHPDLAVAADFGPKIVDWQDFSGEGRVEMTATVPAGPGVVASPFGPLRVEGIPSRSGVLRVGVLDEARLPADGPLAGDLNRNGVATDRFVVVLADAVRAGVYDTVYVDVDGDGDLSEEPAMVPFRIGRGVRRFGGGASPRADQVPFVVTDIGPEGRWVTLGFDGNGHGTHVAGIAAANGALRGGASGVAPGARLMALKALRSDGNGRWEDIARAMTYAAERGARVINLSLATLPGRGPLEAETEAIRRIVADYGVTVVVAVGNGGPGLGTARVPGSGDDALLVGAYLDAAMWRAHFDLEVPGEALWLYSSAGPAADGGLAPTVVGPGVATSTVPRWVQSSGYFTLEGTSMAAPHVAGAAALLWQVGRERRLQPTAARVRQALEAGARPLHGPPVAAQGYGAVWLPAAWAALQGGLEAPPVRLVAIRGAGAPTRGLVDAGDLVSGVGVVVQNEADALVRLAVEATAPWVGVARTGLILPGRDARTIELRLDEPEAVAPGGVTVGFVTVAGAAGPGGYSGVARLPITVIRPDALGEGGPPLAREGGVGPAETARHLVRVPEGATALHLALLAPQGTAGAAARVRMHVFAPRGREVALTGYAGGAAGLPRAERTFLFPEPGIWEVVVYRSAASGSEGTGSALYRLEARLDRVAATPSRLVADLEAGAAPAEVTLSLRVEDRAGTGPFTARAVGLGAPAIVLGPTRGTIREGETVSRTLPDVRPGTALLRVAAVNPSDGAVDLDLYLYRFDPATRRWEAAGTASREIAGGEVIELWDPPPGEYVAVIEGYGVEGEAAFEFSAWILEDAGTVTAGTPGGPAGGPWTVPVRVTVPPGSGEWHGLVILRQVATGEVAAAVPVHVTRGRSPLVITATPKALVAGRPTFVRLVVRDVRGMPVAAALTVNGREYRTLTGEVILPMMPEGESIALQVAVDLEGYVRWQGVLTLPVAPAPERLSRWSRGLTPGTVEGPPPAAQSRLRTAAGESGP